VPRRRTSIVKRGGYDLRMADDDLKGNDLGQRGIASRDDGIKGRSVCPTKLDVGETGSVTIIQITDHSPTRHR